MNYLTKESAQKIADKIMETVPYNINIMNKDGVIIASGDKNRIGTLHKGALKALEMREAYIVHRDTDTERTGINLPIFYNFEIEGVIGISGEVDKVMPIGQIVVTTAQLMIENAIYNDISVIKESRLNDFYYEWIKREATEYDEKFLNQAEYYKIDLYKPRVAVYIYTKRVRYSVIDQLKMMLSEADCLVRQSIEGIMLLMVQDSRTSQRIQLLMDISGDFEQCYVGDVCTIASKAVASMEKIREISQIMHREDRIVFYEKMRTECLLADIAETYSLRRIMDLLEQKDPEGNLQKTILIYANYSEDNKLICEKLFIHRNTLNYRLDRIYEYTQLNPRNGRDLILLYVAALKLLAGKEEEI